MGIDLHTGKFRSRVPDPFLSVLRCFGFSTIIRSMFRRLLNPLKSNSFMLFGARGVGKSTLVKSLLAESGRTLTVDLLDPVQFEQATLGIGELLARIESWGKNGGEWVFIDEVQKAPKLLDVAQKFIDQTQLKFILTGSSARKLKRGGANLLAGRAYTYRLYPFLAAELGEEFDLQQYLSFGGLPRVWGIESPEERTLYLRSYVSTYLKEEIAEEQVVRKLEPFAKFLQIAAQSSGKIVNFSNIARDVGVADHTVKTYFQILEDTLLGELLPAFSESVRKSQTQSPKFYFFDPGVLRALLRQVDQPLTDQNYNYGNLFEHFIVSELKRSAAYKARDFQFSFLRTANDQELDLVIDRPGHPRAVVEIKSTLNIRENDVAVTNRLGTDISGAKLYCLSRDPVRKQFGAVDAVYWSEGIKEIIV